MLRARRPTLTWFRVFFAVVAVALLALPSTSSSAVAPPVLIKEICPSGNCFPSRLAQTDIDGTLYFRAFGTGSELWKSDGTAAGTELVTEIPFGVLTHVGGTLYFDGPAPTEDQADALWKSDGTEAGTEMVTDINPFPGNGGVFGFVGDVGGALMFVGNDGTGTALWRSDGTEAGTFSIGSPPANEVEIVGGTALYQSGGALWKSNGTEAGTVLVKNIDPGCGEQFLTAVVDGTLFFRANDGIHGLELWKSNGTEAGTVLVKDIGPGGGCSGEVDPNPLAGAEGTLFFGAADEATGRELWKSNGTEAGTQLVKDIHPGGRAGFFNSDPSHGAMVGGTLFFQANDGVHGTELWKSNGTEAGTELVKDINPAVEDSNPQSSHPELLVNVGGTLFFSANDGTNGRELWQSDGTEAGTVMVTNLNAGGDSNPDALRNVGGTLYFQADDGVNLGLWKLIPDFDRDGVSDPSDACRTVAEDLDGVADADGCPETDADGDGIFDEVDEQPTTASDRFSDVALGGATAGQIVRLPVGTPPSVQVVDHPNPARGVRVTVSGGSGTCSAPSTPCPRAQVRLDGKGSVIRLRSPGTYTVTDPEATLTVETELDGPAEVELVVNGQPVLVVIEVGEEATIREVDSDGNGSVDEATITPGPGDEITVNGQPTTQPTVIGATPTCNGLAATIYVNTSGTIVGGAQNGQPYRGSLRGTSAANVIVGTAGNDEIEAKGGNDVVCGGDGNDEIEGGGGADRLFGEGGNDTLLAGSGNDTMTGGTGADKFRGGDGRDRATDFTPGQGDTRQSVEQI